MFQYLKKQLEKIRNSDDAVKKRWLVGLSAAAMILIIGLWLIYMNLPAEQISSAEQNVPEPKFWQIFKTGLKTIFSEVSNTINKEKTITIE